MVKFDPVSSSREVMSTSNVHEIQKTKATPKTKNIPMVDGKKRRSDAEIKAQAKLKEDIKIVDLPGIYAMDTFSNEDDGLSFLRKKMRKLYPDNGKITNFAFGLCYLCIRQITKCKV